jgi:hypothetical protein
MQVSSKPDDLEAVRSLADSLQPFASEDRDRIIRWAREKPRSRKVARIIVVAV